MADRERPSPTRRPDIVLPKWTRPGRPGQFATENLPEETPSAQTDAPVINGRRELPPPGPSSVIVRTANPLPPPKNVLDQL